MSGIMGRVRKARAKEATRHLPPPQMASPAQLRRMDRDALIAYAGACISDRQAIYVAYVALADACRVAIAGGMSRGELAALLPAEGQPEDRIGALAPERMES